LHRPVSPHEYTDLAAQLAGDSGQVVGQFN
jgi:hypothetical protein